MPPNGTMVVDGHTVDKRADPETGDEQAQCPYCDEWKGVEGVSTHARNWCWENPDAAQRRNRDDDDGDDGDLDDDPGDDLDLDGVDDDDLDDELDDEIEADDDDPDLVCTECGNPDDGTNPRIIDIRTRGEKTALKRLLQRADQWSTEADEAIEENDYACFGCGSAFT